LEAEHPSTHKYKVMKNKEVTVLDSILNRASRRKLYDDKRVSNQPVKHKQSQDFAINLYKKFKQKHWCPQNACKSSPDNANPPNKREFRTAECVTGEKGIE
jgi:hypothetical protein